MSEVEIERKVSVIFATDVVSYSIAMEAAEARTVKNLRKCWDILDNLFDRHGGKIFNTGIQFLQNSRVPLVRLNALCDFKRLFKIGIKKFLMMSN